jgi:nucleotide-binding universal stress UspA family protein
MTALTTILTATDFSASARHAADRAARLAHETGAALQLLHVLPGEPLQALREWLGAPRLVLGSTAERLLRACHRPLLVVRNPAPGPYRRVLVGVDHSAWCRPALAACAHRRPHGPSSCWWRCSRCHSARSCALPASTTPPSRTTGAWRRSRRTRRWRRWPPRPPAAPGPLARQVVEGDAARGLIEQAESLDCDLLVLGKHGRSATEDLLLGSVTQHVLAECRRDVLVCTAHTPRMRCCHAGHAGRRPRPVPAGHDDDDRRPEAGRRPGAGAHPGAAPRAPAGTRWARACW